MPEPYDFAAIRVVPRVDREEFLNVGAIVFCRTLKYLAARVTVDETRLTALWPDLDIDDVRAHLELIPRICAGSPDAGPIAGLPLSERFHWLVSPRSTIIQPSPVHSGVCSSPAAALDDVFARLVSSTTTG
ncbi:MAG TPA: DUF3037 domain-containing protein [Bryobacteraceae bacterium]|nr:DUF3037 domain-containing protein [Bryobacteraceae bacterium]